MAHKEFVFKSKAQADKIKEEFVARYGKDEGEKKIKEVEARSPKYSDLPDHMTTAFHHVKKLTSLSRRFGKAWRRV